MTDVARRAGVHRGIIYKQFGSRSGLMRALAVRETSRLTDTLARLLAENRASPAGALRSAFDGLTDPSERPLLAALILRPHAGSSPARRTGNTAILTNAAPRLAGLILDTWPSIQRADAEALSDALARLAISYHRLPATTGPANPDSLALIFGAFLERCLIDPDADSRPPR